MPGARGLGLTAAGLLFAVLVFVAATVGATAAALDGAARALTDPATALPGVSVPDPSDPAAPGPGAGPPGAGPSGAVGDIPAQLLPIYRHAAATCPGLPWELLAAIGKIESDHGRSPLPGVHNGANTAGASGLMQELGPTFTAYSHHIPPGGAHPPSVFNPWDAIHTAAAYLCASGARNGTDLPGAVLTYNHSTLYREQVMAQTRRYTTDPPTPAAPPDTRPPPGAPPAPAGPHTLTPPGPPPGGPDDATAGGPGPGSRAGAVAVAFARAQLGVPYKWGGNGPAGFDCSGLTTAAYHAAGIALPRTAQTQYQTGPRLPAGAPVHAGDLVFFGTPSRIHHVGLALGQNTTLMINAPDVGQVVRIQTWTSFPDLAGFTRPSN